MQTSITIPVLGKIRIRHFENTAAGNKSGNTNTMNQTHRQLHCPHSLSYFHRPLLYPLKEGNASVSFISFLREKSGAFCGFYQNSTLLQLVERQTEAFEKMRHKIIEAGKLHLHKRLLGLPGGGLKLGVSGLQLLQAFNVG